MITKIITAFFTTSGVPRTGLTPTVDIIQLDLASNTLVVDNGALTEIGNGWYRYNFTTYDSTKTYVFTIDGGNTVPINERYHVGGNDSFSEDISSGVWEEPTIDHTGLGTTGFMLTQIQADTSAVSISQVTLMNLINTLLKYERNRTRIDVQSGTLTIYDDDCITPLTTFELLDRNGLPTITEICERVPNTC